MSPIRSHQRSQRRRLGVRAGWGAMLALATTAALTAPLSVASAASDPAGGDRSGRAVQTDYPQTTRTLRLKMLTETQAEDNAKFDPSRFGRFTDYFSSPDFGVHVALLPTGKVLLFSFESVEDNPQKEPAPTDVIGRRNAGRAYVWDPAAGEGPSAFKAVPPPIVNMPDGTNEPRPAPFFCAGHSYLPNGMIGVFGGNLGGNGGTGAKLALIFDPWTETWHRQQDMSVGRWYPTVVTDARAARSSCPASPSWAGAPRPPSSSSSRRRTPRSRTTRGVLRTTSRSTGGRPRRRTGWTTRSCSRSTTGRSTASGATRTRSGGSTRPNQSRTKLPDRPDGGLRNYGSAVALPNGTKGPDSVLILGGNRNDPNTYRFSGGAWHKDTPRAFGRTQDDTLILPDGTLLTVNGAYDIRNYGNGDLNPNADLKYRQTEMRGADGKWTLGPSQRLPRGYHSNAVILPDGRIMVTGDELQQIANNPDIKSGQNGTIEIYEPAYLHQGPRPVLSQAPAGPIGYGADMRVGTTTPSQVSRAVLLAPITSTHSVDTSQRHLDLRIAGRAGNTLVLKAPPSAKAAPPGYYMLFLLNDKGVPSMAKWVQLAPGA